MRLKHIQKCCTCDNAFCAKLKPETRERIARERKWVEFFKKNQQVFFFSNQQLMIIESGSLMTIRYNPKGKQHGVDFVTAGDILGIVQLFKNDQEYQEYEDIYILPLSDVKGCVIPVQTVQELALNHPDFAQELIKVLSNRVSRLISRFLKYTCSTQDKIGFLLERTRELGITLTHEEISMYTGLNRVTVTNALNKKNKKD